MQDELSDFDKEDIDYAIALSLSEVDQKGKKAIGKLHCYKHWPSTFIPNFSQTSKKVLMTYNLSDDSVLRFFNITYWGDSMNP